MRRASRRDLDLEYSASDPSRESTLTDLPASIFIALNQQTRLHGGQLSQKLAQRKPVR